MKRSHTVRLAALFALGGLTAFGPVGAAAHAASAPPARSLHARHAAYDGYLMAAPTSTTAPATLNVQTRYRGQIVVTVTPATKIIRRYGAPSGLDEISANDVLQIQGATTAPGMVTATRIRDLSIQAAYTRLVGKVTAVTPTAVSVVVQRDARRAPFIPGSNLTLPVGASTKVISGTTTTTGSTGALAVGDRVIALGVFNSVAHNFQSTFRIRIIKG